jgi:membrane-associated phospholipid phosphatase
MTSNLLPARPVLLAGILAPLWLAMLLLGTGAVDRDILYALYTRDEPLLMQAAIGITQLGNWWTVVGVTLAGALLLFYRGKKWGVLTLLIATFTGRGLVILQKDYFARLRPEENLRLVEVSYQSFPSGHAANPTIAYVALALLLFDDPKRRRVAVLTAMVLALLIGISRPMLGVHWPSDVVAGWAFGLMWIALIFAMMERWKPRRAA